MKILSIWLPAPTDKFSLTMRVYLAQPTELNPLYARLPIKTLNPRERMHVINISSVQDP